MKQFTLILLMLGVALAGLISTAEARGMGRGVGNASCPAWNNASYTTGAAGGSGMRMMRGVGYGHGYAQGAGHGSGHGYGWMRGATAQAQAVPAAPAQSQQ